LPVAVAAARTIAILAAAAELEDTALQQEHQVGERLPNQA
jgi:hypothetical protein